MLDGAGDIYGTTYEGGTAGDGTVFKLSPGKKGQWTEKILYSFKGGTKDGSYPAAGPAFDAAGNIYGTTQGGGKNGYGTVYELVAPTGTGSYKEKVLWSFASFGLGGFEPWGSLVLDGAGNLYGTTEDGGDVSGDGIVFQVTP